MSATNHCTAWYLAIGRPKVWRCLRVRDGFVQRRLSHAERLRGDADAAAIERPPRELEPAIHLAQHVVGATRTSSRTRSMHPRPRTPSESGPARCVTPGAIERHEERRDAAAARAGLRGREHDPKSAAPALATQTLRPDSRQPSPSASRRSLVGGIGARVLLGEREAADGRRRSRAGAASAIAAARRAEPRDHFGDEELFATTRMTATVALARATASIASAALR